MNEQRINSRDGRRAKWFKPSLAALVIAGLLCLSLPARSQDPGGGGAVPGGKIVNDADTIRLTVNKSKVVSTTRPYKRVSIGQPDVAEVTPVNPTSVLLTARKAGSTQLILWDDADRAQVMEVVVAYDTQALNDQLRSTFPGSQVEAVAGNGAIVLRGHVPNLTVADQATQLAGPYGTKVLNFLEVAGGQQVMLQVRFAEVSRSASSALGVNFGLTDGRSIFGSNVGSITPLGLTDGGAAGVALAVPSPAAAVTMFGRGEAGQVAFDYFISALRQNNLLRILAEPNVVAMSGQEATFLAGGQIPIPVVQNSSGASGPTITIEKWEYGVKLTFTPIVLGDGRIRLKVSPEVSDLDYTTAVKVSGFVIPGMTQRKLTTTVELAEGQTFALAGLLNQSVAASKDVTPGLGDIPVLGALFRSVRYQRKETELVVMVTPRLVEALNPSQVPLAPGEKWRHPTEVELFGNQDLGGPVRPQKPSESAPAAGPRIIGSHGFATPTTAPAMGKAPAGPATSGK